ncbi:hypothetical protein [Roseicitreum antarcticum]|uniref:Uncharacterized protein n=1 Tax=Roseicitreum antarcticum TaxID=564137 RepID=A0A1H3EQR7_9RHOB|nr:hypothetical protein [Roseicitreum antarcticum]SDX81061.1 hypothetical protein SAMN04488238_1252 [Roseicitreum antarcticum]
MRNILSGLRGLASPIARQGNGIAARLLAVLRAVAPGSSWFTALQWDDRIPTLSPAWAEAVAQASDGSAGSMPQTWASGGLFAKWDDEVAL